MYVYESGRLCVIKFYYIALVWFFSLFPKLKGLLVFEDLHMIIMETILSSQAKKPLLFKL